MDGKFLTTVSKYLDDLELFPYFYICHYVIISIQVRELAPGKQAFSRIHPLASWVATMILCFAGSIVSNFFIGEPLIIPLKYHENMLHASLCWYLVNYFPFDLCYKISKFLPFYLAIYLGKELYRCRMISIGMTVAVKRFPDSFLVWLIIGLCKGCGEDLILPIAQACMGEITTNQFFLLKPSFNIKGSLAVSIMFGLEKLQKVPLASNQLFLAALMFMTYFRISSLVVGIKDPFIPFENIICGLFFGGLIDAIKRVSQSPSQPISGEKKSHGGGSGDSADNCCYGNGSHECQESTSTGGCCDSSCQDGEAVDDGCYDDINNLSTSSNNGRFSGGIDDEYDDNKIDTHASMTTPPVTVANNNKQGSGGGSGKKKNKNKQK